MTSKLTREERVQSLYDLKIGQVLNPSDIENIKMLARMALAAMDSEPVAWLWSLDGDAELDVSLTPPDDDDDASDAIECGWTATPLYRHAQQPVVPSELHPDTQKLVIDFCTALAEKLYKAQLKYGYEADWKQDGWTSQCQAHFHQHIAKGDPRDVAAYCAFMWWHGWSTKPAEGLEFRTVTVKLPDYRNTYKSSLADEVEHQVLLALELFSSATGIKWEAE